LCVWKLRGGMKGVELVNVKSSLNNDGKFWISVKKFVAKGKRIVF